MKQADSETKLARRVQALAFAIAALGLALLLPARTAFAQAAYGLISGTVVDPQGASIPGATVTVTNEQTHISQKTQTSATGDFVFPALLPATYTISAEKEGFEKLDTTGVVLLAGSRLSVRSITFASGVDEVRGDGQRGRHTGRHHQFPSVGLDIHFRNSCPALTGT